MEDDELIDPITGEKSKRSRVLSILNKQKLSDAELDDLFNEGQDEAIEYEEDDKEYDDYIFFEDEDEDDFP